ncbi:glycine receptor subunit alpha-1-like isoform X2 [Mercenaria mercenaria]|uniref:glycine receptor subunit alpha-1-like isoform X2 n=1 Tax=Mercenaria mercenaria TaxID=6596 RepID=UPI00234EF629|nr:glycine receptor subunit alpha-1-like isoform X2 [Mercenaria mercenaria]
MTMTVRFSALVFFIFIFVIYLTNGKNIATDSGYKDMSKYELLHYLLNKTSYDASIPPDYFSGRATDVHVQIAIYDIISENEQNMDHKTIFPGFIGKNELIYIGRNGNIRFSGRISTILICRMDLTLYPYDVQHCQMTLQSYAYTEDDVQLHWKEDNPVIVNGDEIKDYPKWRNSSFGSQCDEPVGNFSILNTGIQIKRTSHSFSQFISTPVVLVSIAMTSFSFGDNFTPRVTLSGASMTTIIMHWAGIYNKIQPASALVWLDKWMLINLCFVGGIILFTAIIYHVKHPKEIAAFKHLMEESITVQLERCRKRWPEWNEVKTWKLDKKNKQITSTVDKETTLDDSLAIRTEKDLRWTVDRRFYAVKNDELREKYYREFVESMEKDRSRLNLKLFNICRHYSRRFILDVLVFVVFVLSYVCFAAIYVNLWQNKHFNSTDD